MDNRENTISGHAKMSDTSKRISGGGCVKEKVIVREEFNESRPRYWKDHLSEY